MMEKLCYLSFHRMEVMQRKTWPRVFVCLFVFCLFRLVETSKFCYLIKEVSSNDVQPGMEYLPFQLRWLRLPLMWPLIINNKLIFNIIILGIWRPVIGWVVTEVSQDLIAFILILFSRTFSDQSTYIKMFQNFYCL